MAKNKTILGGLLVTGVAIMMMAPAANALVLNANTCLTWTGAATGNASAGTCSEPAPLSVQLKMGNTPDHNAFCFSFEPSGNSEISSTKLSTGPLSFRVTQDTTDSISFDWFYVKVNGVEVHRSNFQPTFQCAAPGTRSVSIAVPAGLNSITFGVHQDGFGDPFAASVAGISV